MALNGPLILRDAQGKLVTDTGNPVGFNGGTPVTIDRKLTVTDQGGPWKVAGLEYDVSTKLAESITGPAVNWIAGVPLNAGGEVWAEDAPILFYAPNAIPITASGAVAMSVGLPPDGLPPLVLADFVTTSDSITLASSIERLLTDEVFTADPIAFSASVSLSDTASSIDAISTSLPKILSDTVVSTDVIAQSVSKGFADTTTSADVISQTFSKSLVDSVTSADNVTIDRVVSLVLTDNVSTIDNIDASEGSTQSVSDSASTTDSIVIGVTQSLVDVVGTADSITVGLTQNLSDSVGTTDNITLSPGFSRDLTDSVSAIDTIAIDLSRPLADSASSIDNVSVTPGKDLADSAASTDNITKSLDKAAADSATTTDNVTTPLSISRTITDNVSTSDNVTSSRVLETSLSDSVGTTDDAVPTHTPGPAFQTITYVGGQVSGRAGSTSALSVNFALTGGSDAVPKENDLVIVTCVVGSAARNAAQAITTPAGYIALGQLNQSAQTNDTSMNVSYKFMGSTPDTSVTIPSTGNNADGQAYTIQVFRGVDALTPLDVAAVSAGGTGTGRPDPGALTPATSGAWIVICGGGAAATAANYVAPANFTTNFLTTNLGQDTTDAMVGSGYWSGWTSGAVNPTVYTGGTTNSIDSWASYTLALRPGPVLSNISSPAALFAAGEGGMWFDPSDLSTLFQDAAGTVPVTAPGDPVGKILDKSGRGNHATQATAGNRPIYQVDSTGKAYLAFDGANTGLETASINPGVDKMSIWVGIHKNVNTNTQAIFESSVDPNANPFTMGMTVPAPVDEADAYGFRTRGDQSLLTAETSPIYPSPRKDVLYAALNNAGASNAAKISVRISSAAATLTYPSGAGGTGNYANHQFYIGRRAGTLIPFDGRIYGLVSRFAATYPQHVQNIEDWMRDKTVGPASTPADLFSAGEQGIWLDPSDLSTMFQDTAGTQPVTAPGQFVGKMLDKSGRGNHFTSPGDSNRPTYQVDGNGKPHLVMAGPNAGIGSGFDGAGATTYGASPHIFCCIGAYKSQDTFMQYIIEHSTTSHTSAGTFTMRFPATATPNGDSGWRTRGSGGAHELLSPAVAAPFTAVLTGRSNLAAPSSLHRVNGIQQAAATTALGGNTTSFVTYIGRRGTGDGYFNGRLYGLVTRFTVATSDADMATIEQWMADKAGISI